MPVKVEDKPTQERQCPRCRNWWRVDVTLISRDPSPAVKAMHRLDWLNIGKLRASTDG